MSSSSEPNLDIRISKTVIPYCEVPQPIDVDVEEKILKLQVGQKLVKKLLWWSKLGVNIEGCMISEPPLALQWTSYQTSLYVGLESPFSTLEC